MVAELGEPEAMLVDEVDREHVPARRNRSADARLDVAAFARRCTHRRPQPVPVDWVAALVEPMVGEVQVAPGRSSRVLERCVDLCQRSRLQLRYVEPKPTHGEGAGGNV